jgi:ribosomal protection tetracycline resistance protein
LKTPSINLGILAHADAGKTSVTERLLLLGGGIRQAGSVDDGTTHTDRLEVERRRGISVRSASVTMECSGVQLNLIDTPGHVDFLGEVERCLSALDGAVLVLSAVEGVQAQTRLLWRALENLEIPTLLLVNKVDRLGCDLESVLEQLRQECSVPLLPAETVEEAGSENCRVLPREEFWEDVLAWAAESDDELAQAYLEERPVKREQLIQALRTGIAERKAFPVLFASAKTGEGLPQVLEAITAWLPRAPQQEEEPLSAVVYQVDHDPQMGKAAHVRVFSGSLKNRDSIPLPGGEGQQKITQIRRFYGQRAVDIGEVHCGEVGAVYGLSSVRAGDILGQPPPRKSFRLAAPLLQVQAFAPSAEELPRLVEALQELAQEDPLLDLEWIPESRELLLRITGKIQLEVLTEVIRERYGLEASFSSPTVIYKETPASTAQGEEVYLAPKPCWAIVQLLVEPLPRGSGIQFESVIKEKELPYRYQNHVRQSLPEALKQGRRGWEVTDAKFTLVGGQHHHVHTHPLDFFVATPVAVQRALVNSGTLLLEPMVRVTLSAQEDLLGKVIRDLVAMRGNFDTPLIRQGQFTLEAELPVATSLDYPTAFRSMTSGKGTYASEFIGYQECPPGEGKDSPRRGVDPLDHAKWILYARSAMQS